MRPDEVTGSPRHATRDAASTEAGATVRERRRPRRPLVLGTLAATATICLVPLASAAAFTVTTSPTSAPPGGFVAVKLVEASGVSNVGVQLDGKTLVSLRPEPTSGAIAEACVLIPKGTTAGVKTLRFVGDDGTEATAQITVDGGAAGATDTCKVTSSGTPTTSTTTTGSTTSTTGSSTTTTSTSTSTVAASTANKSTGSLANTGASIATVAAIGALLAGSGALLRMFRRSGS